MLNQKKQVLLVMPRVPYTLEDWPLPPLGILYVSAYMKKQGLCVHCINLSLCGEHPLDVLKQTIREKHIDIVATGDLVVNYLAVKEIVDCAKEASQDIVTIIGGGLVTHSPEEAMALIPNADYGVIGEGELTDSELVTALEKGCGPTQVPGIIYRSGSELRRTPPRPAIENLDDLPWPDYEGFQYFELVRQCEGSEKLSAPLTTSRSCPFQCTFCSTSGGGVQKKYRQRSLDSVFEELRYLVDTYRVKKIFLNDELFAVNEERLLEFCRRIKPFNLNWYVFLRLGKHIQLDLLLEMRRAGCTAVFYGLESAHNEILKSMKKGTTQEEMLRVLKITKEAGLITRGAFIFGDTQETLETAEYTMRWVEDHCDLLETATFQPIVLYPGSELYERAVKSKKIPDPVQFIREQCPLVNPSERMSEKEYQILVNDKVPSFSGRYHAKVARQHQKKLQERIEPLIGEKCYLHTFHCAKCGAAVRERLYPLTILQYSYAKCQNCDAQYELYPGEIMLHQYEPVFSKLLERDGCAVWGTGVGAHALYYNNAYFREHTEIPIFDNDKKKQAIGFHGRPVFPPDELSAAPYPVILCATNYEHYRAISKQLAQMAVVSAKIFWLYDLLLDSGHILE